MTNKRIAVLVSGQARFSPDFDSFLDKLRPYSNVDWYFHFWRPDNDLVLHTLHTPVLPNKWKNPNNEWAFEKLSVYIPPHHNIRYLGFSDPNEVTVFNPRYHQTNRPKNVGLMFLGWKKVMAAVPDEYDLLIRTRLDVGVSENFDLNTFDPELLTASNNGWHGIDALSCDIINISGYEVMYKTCQLYDHIQVMIDKSYTFHPETLLGLWVRDNNIAHVRGNFNNILRSRSDPNPTLNTDPRWN